MELTLEKHFSFVLWIALCMAHPGSFRLMDIMNFRNFVMERVS